jgi:hypothetical protein
MRNLLRPDPEKIVDIPVSQLRLDSANPRLAWRTDGDSQDELVKILWNEMAVDELAWSIAENGFFRSEPLFVIVENPEETDPAKQMFIVVEGNRRFTAVLLLRDEKLRKKVKAVRTDALPKLDPERHASLDKLPAIVHESRETLWTTVGFRHINGIKPWDSFSKAKYVAEVHETYGVPLNEIAQRIGDRNVTVKRLYRGYKVLEQAESQGVFNRTDKARNRFYFSHLYTAIDYPEIQEFLGITPEDSLTRSPVPQANLGQLDELLTWLYGKKSENIEPVVRTQNPDLNTLRRVIARPDSLSVLRRTNRLEVALDVAIGDEQRFWTALSNAKVELQNAKATVTTGYTGSFDLYETVVDILAYAETIKDEMEMRLDSLGDNALPSKLRRRRDQYAQTPR